MFPTIAIVVVLAAIHFHYSEDWRIYILLTSLGALVIVDRHFMHLGDVYRARLEDASYVRSLIRQAKEYTDTEVDESNLPEKANLKSEICCLDSIGQDHWTEYQVLPLERKLAEFFCDSDLISKSTEKLSELNEYAQDSHYRYDIEEYYKWQTKIGDLIEEISTGKTQQTNDNKTTGSNGESGQDPAIWTSKRLVSEYKSLLAHISSYKHDWNEGSTIIRNLIICTVSSIMLFLIMGIIPIIYPDTRQSLGVVHWGLLGSAGALTAVARDFRKTDLMAVGNTFGKKELWRAILGSVLGFIAGLILWSLIIGEVLEQGVFPDLTSNNISIKDCALSVFWAIVAGFSFDRIFDQVRTQGDAGIR